MTTEHTNATEAASRDGSPLTNGLGAADPKRKVMRLAKIDYVEKSAKGLPDGRYGLCSHCALLGTEEGCADAIDGAAEAAFGGDCETRNVVYVRA